MGAEARSKVNYLMGLSFSRMVVGPCSQSVALILGRQETDVQGTWGLRIAFKVTYLRTYLLLLGPTFSRFQNLPKDNTWACFRTFHFRIWLDYPWLSSLSFWVTKDIFVFWKDSGTCGVQVSDSDSLIRKEEVRKCQEVITTVTLAPALVLTCKRPHEYGAAARAQLWLPALTHSQWFHIRTGFTSEPCFSLVMVIF